ncbi:MAG: hypothetical protein JSS04_14305 [Proteobacteria bacterium]|nr:hypothetical protein [Pseudomonadota bacterium]
MSRRHFLPLLVLASGLPVLVAAWAVLSPPHVVSSEMTWDLMFNLAGAWHLWFGHVPHADFHEPVGTLTFLLTEAGFWLTGPSPKAVPVGMSMVAAVLFAIACLVAARRLSLLPGVLSVVFVCLIVLRPANVGDHPNAYSFAMAYNRYGWGGLSVLALLLFEPPARRGAADIVEMACTALVLAALFYLKMTYFAAGVAMLVLALVASPHVRTRWPGWAVVVLASVALVLLPFNGPYLADLRAAADAGIVRDDVSFFFNDFAENAGEYAAYFAAIGLAVWLWHRRLAPARLPIAAAFLLVMGLLLLSQDSQAHSVPLAVVIAFLFHAQLRRQSAAPALRLAVLVFPLAAIVASATSLAGYRARLGAGYLRTVDKTNLGGLAVPMEPEGLLADVEAGRDRFLLFGRTRAIRPRYELSPFEYVETLMEAAALLEQNGLASGRIAVLDQVDPLPFMLGLEPPRGGNLWSGAGAPTPSPEDYLADADRVLIPKFTTNFAWTEQAKAAYGAYIAGHFPMRLEGRGWIVASRSGLAGAASRR